MWKKTPAKSIKAVIHLTENDEIMFIVTYFYNVLKNKVRQFLDIKRRAKKVYFRHGCMDYEIFRSDNDSAWRLIDSEAKNTMVKEHILEP